jgi:excisionase family DNA binding protein
MLTSDIALMELKTRTRSGSQKLAWTVPDWGEILGIPLGTVREMVIKKQIASVRSGKRRLITTSPQDYIVSLADAEAAE